MLEMIKDFCASIGIEVTEEQIKEYQTRKLANDLYNTTQLIADMYYGKAKDEQHLVIGGEAFTIFKSYVVLEDDEDEE